MVATRVKRKCMTARLGELGVFVAVGVALSVAIAWCAVAVHLPTHRKPDSALEPSSARWPADAPAGYPARPSHVTEWRGSGLRHVVLSRPTLPRQMIEELRKDVEFMERKIAARPGETNDDFWEAAKQFAADDAELLASVAEGEPGYSNYVWVRAGWPLPALEGGLSWREEATLVGTSIDRPVQTHGAVPLHARAFSSPHSAARIPTPLPLRPLAGGLILNAVLYAIVARLAWCLPVGLRRWLRARGGACPRCAYPRGAGGVCSECGLELTDRVRKSRRRVSRSGDTRSGLE